jgi:hypothetical protein
MARASSGSPTIAADVTFAARIDRLHPQATSQIVSVDVTKGARIEHTAQGTSGAPSLTG